jgi:hypothetical protein
MQNLRDLAGNPAYFEINREERNVAALLYHLLLSKKNLSVFLDDLGYKNEALEKVELYYEFAYVRDLWKKLPNDNDKKRDFIVDSLVVNDVEHLIPKTGVKEFNTFFGATRAESEKHIVSPANWSILGMSDMLKENQSLFEAVCMLKWGFNVKPDLVVVLPNNRAICIEAKWDSTEGTYKGNDLFKNVKQLHVQKYVMEEILNYDQVDYVYLTKSTTRGNAKNEIDLVLNRHWNQIFQKLDYSDSLPFAQKWIERIINLEK